MIVIMGCIMILVFGRLIMIFSGLIGLFSVSVVFFWGNGGLCMVL